MSKKIKIEGEMVIELIPSKVGRITAQPNIVTLTFKVKGGGTLQLLAQEIASNKAAKKFQQALADRVNAEPNWTKPLLVPTISETEDEVDGEPVE